MKTKLFMAALAIVLSMGVASAQNGNGNGKGKNQTQKPNKERPCVLLPGTNKTCVNFIDVNKNGVCDNFENGTCSGNCKGTGTPVGTKPQDGTGQKKGRKK
ncbi:hypothetical protein D0T51_11410 [Parabacteroides sp. 52]|uniref:hypothetical protein n=1 Tax=unclassified Parabacteroides TaxID=2649774 RepID=UPI0013D297EB|nr:MULTISPECIES: hypothetical protein [unclassified Parabacteroides]MDH6535720.1 hypothetical protein [Parabacteroides sp. PM5-20]NDV56333.1 hypothetical protein [Parabacteroides sp. 52]